MGSILPPPGEPRPLAEGEFVQSAPPNVVTFSIQGVEPPSPVYVQRDDVLVIEGISDTADEALNVLVRFLPASPTSAGQPAPAGAPGTIKISPPGSTSLGIISASLRIPLAFQDYTLQVPLAEGYLLSLSLIPLSAMRRGQVFGRAYIQRGTAGGYSTNCSLMLVADYITNQVPANWPNGTLKSPCEGPGRLVSVRSVAPAAGLDWSYAVPVDFRFRVQSVSALLTTSAHVSNRTVTAWIKDAAGNIVFQSDGVHTQAAGLAYRYSLVPGVAMASLTSVDQVLPFPHDLILPAGFSIGTETLLLDAADQWSDAWLLVERWFEND
jgi:hypothetical protein